jgi:nucleotidyltransferase AbiEii toxin of type IV toxin-antitoxin system
MFGDGSLTFREFATREPLRLAMIHDSVLEFLRGRRDAVLCGAHAVNAYVDEPRMTQDVDMLSPRGAALAEELRAHLYQQFQIEVRIQTVGSGFLYRLHQVRQPKDRHLVDVRSVDTLPDHRLVEKVLVSKPIDLICQKVVSMLRRSGTAKEMTDLADIYRLLLAFPQLKAYDGEVTNCLWDLGAPDLIIDAWHEIVDSEILPEDDDAGF